MKKNNSSKELKIIIEIMVDFQTILKKDYEDYAKDFYKRKLKYEGDKYLRISISKANQKKSKKLRKGKINY